jgi:hypothetical protein
VKNEIIKNYLDIIEWVRSPFNENKDYSLTPVESIVFQRLLKYSRVNEIIIHSNLVISEHMFRSKRQIEKIIPSLKKKELILCEEDKPKFKDGNFTRKRRIKINWSKLNEIKDEMDHYIQSKRNKISDVTTDSDHELIVVENNEKEGSFLHKNQYYVHKKYIGVGSQISLYYLNEDEKKEFYTQTLNGRFKKYLESIGKSFFEFTKYDLINLNADHTNRDPYVRETKS